MDAKTARNIGIIVAIAAVVAFLPGGGESADLLSAVLSAVFVVIMVFIAGQVYRRFRTDIYGLGDRWRLALYVAVGAILVAIAAATRLLRESGGAGVVLWFALMGGAAYTLYAVWQQHRAYD